MVARLDLYDMDYLLFIFAPSFLAHQTGRYKTGHQGQACLCYA